MAQEEQNTSSGQVRTFDKSLNEDVNDFHLPSNNWTQARNAVNNSITGDLGKLGNEPANLVCLDNTKVPYPIIGTIHVIEDKWLIYSTDNTNNEIGIFKEDICTYVPLVNNQCLGFSLNNLIIGVSRPTSTCTYIAYWDDGLNPSRTLEFNGDFIDQFGTSDYFNPNEYDAQNSEGIYTSTIPWIKTCITNNGCVSCDNTPNVDCDKLRLAQFISPICTRVEKGYSGGNLLNGSYFVTMAYAVNGQKISDWYVSNVQGLFSHENSSSSLDVFIDSIDSDYNEIIVGVGSVTNQQTVVRQAGIYSTRQTKISFDIISDTWPAIPIEQIPIMTPIVDKSDAMYNVGDYLIRVGPTSKFDFNYQPLANQIRVKWQSVEYPTDYYHKGGNNVGYMRDEVYAFFIQWIYDTGDKSASYHIPGRPAFTTDLVPIAPGTPNAILGDNVTWQIFNTATQTGTPGTVLPDGGVVIAEGYMGYWESTELYPDNKPEIWDASSYCWSALDPSSFVNPTCPGPFLPTPYPGTTNIQYDLCGKPIRHHKFPEDNLNSNTQLYRNNGEFIRIMGVDFENIRAPRDNEGNLIPGIVGYRILRSTRNGNKTVIAKGMINHMREYTIPGTTGKRGLMPNYPYNDLRQDPFLSSSITKTDPITGVVGNITPMPAGFGGVNSNRFSENHYTFHSPDTNFNNPYLATKEFRMYGAAYGTVNGKFDLSEKHPKEKLITNLSFFMASVAGVGIALVAANGVRQTTYKEPQTYGLTGTLLGTGAGTLPSAADLVQIPLNNVAINIATGVTIPLIEGLIFPNTVGPGLSTGRQYGILQNIINSTATAQSFTKTTEHVQSNGYLDDLGPLSGLGIALPMFLQYFSDGTDSIIRLIKSIVRYRDFAIRYHSHGFYNQFAPRNANSLFRAELSDQQYLNPEIADINLTYKINNLFRQRTVHFETLSSFLQAPSTSTIGAPVDNTRFKLPNSILGIEDISKDEYKSDCSSFYGALKVRIRNQYGQIGSIVQLPTSSCYTAVTFDTANGTEYPSGNILTGDSTVTQFGGDVYINRYTEKNTFFYFYDWLEGQPDGAQLNYAQKVMIPYPTYWANFNDFQTSDFTSKMFSNLPGSLLAPTGTSTDPAVPSDYYALDGPAYSMTIGGFIPDFLRFDKRGWFYLFSSGVRDFFVESEINVAYRDYNETPSQRFYDPYQGTDTKELFNTAIIKSGNFYKYDISLSVTKLFINYTSWASTQSIAYNPYVSETCFVYQPTRVIYSLPSQFEGLKDGWRVFLANNYYDFNNYVTCIKPINKSGAIIFFDAASPVQFQGTDQLQTSLGTKLTIGDGGLFSQPLQALINVEASHEYGSCQNRLSVINTPAGIYWMSQNQGKIFTVAGQGLKEISNINMKWWFAQYLPYQIVKDYPTFELLDNPVIGVGCQSMYDNENGLLYFCKKDYKLKPNTPYIPVYLGGNQFLIGDYAVLKLGDPVETDWKLYFEDASWTVSYDPKTDGWLSYHDWHPSLNMPGKNTFMTINPNDLKSVWIHNERCDLYCNYYGIDYPFEVEFTVNTGQAVNSLRSIQYYLESYKYSPNCYDRFHVLDYNFDEATIYNTEQTSGLLKLVLNPKQDPTAILQYPIINPTNINVLFSKEENKYRFNQFWDVTEDRGEYFNPAIPGFAERAIWNTQANGYVRLLNANNLNYNKDPFQRKKFRHYTVSVLLRKLVSGNKKMLVMLADVKNLLSPR
jgi:hypothetical protein